MQKKAGHYCLMLFVVLALLSCSSAATKFTGVVVYGHEVRTVRLCGEPTLLWLHTSSAQNLFLTAETQRLIQYPYQNLYLDFSGSIMKEGPGELAKVYDGTIRLEKIHKLSIEIPDNCNSF